MKRLLAISFMFLLILPAFSQTEDGTDSAPQTVLTDEAVSENSDTTDADGFVSAPGSENREADSENTNTEADNIQSDVVYKTNQAGDQYMILKLSVDVPYRPFKKLIVGGSGTLGYQRFIVKGLTLGGDVSFAYSQTIGKNVFYFVPILFRAGWQFSAGKFEFPLSLGIGGAFENYLDRTYFGLAVHPNAAVFFRYNNAWSFGAHTGLYILPQWYKNPKHNYTGLIHDIGLSVRYHF